MKIEYKAVGASSYTTLGDEADRSALVESFAPGFVPLNQIEPLAGASNSAKFARGNTAATVALMVSIPYASKAAALAGIKTLLDAFLTQSHLKLTEGATTHYYPNAVLTGYQPTLRGLTVQHNFTWASDKVTTTAP